MKISQIVTFLCLSFLFSLDAKAQLSEKKFFKSPLSDGYRVALYQGEISFGKKKLSGLFVFKYDAIKKSHDIVCMSELGMSLLKYKYEDNRIKLIENAPFFQNKKMLNLMKKYCMFLIQDIAKNTKKVKEKQQGFLVKTKFRKHTGTRGKAFYSYNSKGILTNIDTRGFLPLHFTISESTPIPKMIDFRQYLLGLSIKMKLIKIEI